MGLSWKDWSKNDLIYAVIIPILVIFLIVLISKLPSFFGGGFGIVTGLVMEIEELVALVCVPLALGLIWNRWAGGASGFLMGTFYALRLSSSYHNVHDSGTVLLAYILGTMLIGYMAGALNKRSDNFIRLLISGIVAAAIGGLIEFSILEMSTANVVTGINGFLLTVLPRTACGAILAVIAKVFIWYGLAPKRANTP